ncbi:MAG: N-acetylmuramoyl-L-alanine amidase, partial [Lacibacter sp.]|nr:N-acetylmuramoyl-L-alanine amidase [Lacibacter sp.]
MSKLISLLSFCCFVLFTAAQTKRKSENYFEYINFQELRSAKLQVKQVINLAAEKNRAKQTTKPVEVLFAIKKLKLAAVAPFLAFSCGWNEMDDAANNSQLFIRFSADSTHWNEWLEIKQDEDYEKTKYSRVSTIIYANADQRYYQLKVISNKEKKGNVIGYLFLNFFSPGKKTESEAGNVVLPTEQPRPFGTTITCNCALPSFTNRAGWNCPQQSWNPSSTTVTHLIVHHSAGVNTSSDFAATVLSIWNTHTTTNGYTDIAYNWLIDPNGVIYEGRYKSSTDNITGAHFCGTNGGTMGVCMLGTYTTETATSAAKNSLIRLLSWKVCERNIDPLATLFHSSSNLNINTISGHRQGCATECPGTLLYADLQAIRTSVQNYCQNGCILTPVVEIDGLESFSLSPNPATGSTWLKIKLNAVKTVQYKIISTDGKTYYTSSLQKWSGVQTVELNVVN